MMLRYQNQCVLDAKSDNGTSNVNENSEYREKCGTREGEREREIK